jgi:FkbM family methyltransferase
MPDFTSVRTITTVWGRFHFFGDLYSYLILNPSFERPDMEFFVGEIGNYLDRKERILFLDLGTNVGLYAVGIPHRVGNGKFTIHAFEPEPGYFGLLQTNIKENKIKNIHLHNVALGSKNATVVSKEFVWPGHPVKTVKFRIRRLDGIFIESYLKQFDRIVMKIDIEGHEEEALLGSEKIFRLRIPTLLMVEDSVKPEVRKFLDTNGFTYKGRISPYNSYWEHV